MKKLLYALFMSVAFFACSEDSGNKYTSSSIVGSVSDKTTGEPVATVNVTLYSDDYYYESRLQSTVTGSDGSFTFDNLDEGYYTIEIDKEGYNTNAKNVYVNEAETASVHMLIERKPAIVTTDRNTLDFGSDKSVNTLSFNIVNSSYEDLAWDIEENCEWISEVKPASGTLKYGKTETIMVIIDRNKLDGGENRSVIVVTSSNGSSEIEITATGEYKLLPELETYAATGVRAYSATLNGKIINAGTPEYNERGFVYGTSTLPTLENCIARVPAAKNSTKEFSCNIKELELGQKYYVRAYAISSAGAAYSSYDITFETVPVAAVVSTQAATDINLEKGSATLHGTVTSVGEPAYSERGFVYGTSPQPTINDNKIVNSGSGTGAFSNYATGLPTDVTVYIRAYATNEAGTAYGEEVTIEPEFVILSAAKLMVQKEDLGDVDWSSANSLCESSIVGGYTDWRLPTRDELMVLYNNREKIGGFVENYYWSSTYGFKDGMINRYYTVYFKNGSLAPLASYYNYRVRAVRSIE